MPLYDFRCDECRFEFEEWWSYNDDPTKERCPECMSTTTIIISSTPVHYKGAGFQTTESRGITGRKRKPDIKVGLKADLPDERG